MASSSSRFQLISKKFVKPSLSTPPSLRNYKLSLLDQLMTSRFIPMALFYNNCQHKHQHCNATQISSLLEESLSKTLACYYPLAGTLIDNNIFVDCNDVGATFLEVRIKCKMSEILEEVNIDAHNIMFPEGLPRSPGHDQPTPVVAQLSHFDCGGTTLSVCMNHKFGDGHTLCNFINDWAAMARRQSPANPSPQFIGASILPPNDDAFTSPLLDMKQVQQCIITRRFVFDSERLNQLRAKATADKYGIQNPTRVEVVSALLYKCAVSAAMECSGSIKPSALAFIANSRELIGLPSTQNYVGNFVSPCHVSTADEQGLDLARLVSEIRKMKVEKCEKYKGIKGNDLASTIAEDAQQINVLQGNNEIDVYNCSSFCRFPTYHIDFGWEMPIRVSLAAPLSKNSFILMDDHKLDGIEALVTLEEQVMSVFESDPELLAFISPA